MKKIGMWLSIFCVMIITLFSTSFVCANYKTSSLTTEERSEQLRREKDEYIKNFTSSFIKDFFRGKELFNGNRNIAESEKRQSDILVTITAIILISYWGILFWNYEKEEEQENLQYIDDQDIFKKYNPLLAGCFLQERNVYTRDVIAVILNLVNKGIVKLETIQDVDSKSGYRYQLSRIIEKEQMMDATERYVHNWFFDIFYHHEDKIDLATRLKEMSQNKEVAQKIVALNKLAKKELNEKGANQNRVPKELKFIHFFVLFATVFLIAMHIYNNGLHITIYQSTFLILGMILFGVILVIPLVAILIQAIISLFFYSKSYLKEKIQTKTLYVTIIFTAIVFGLIILGIAIFAQSKYLILDTILLAIAVLIVKTDHLMMKNNKEVLNDFYNLKVIKDKIEDYSLLNEKDVEQITLWENYLSYAVSFGVSEKVMKKMKGVYADDLILQDLNANGLESVYQISKSYLEVFWEMDFSNQGKFTNWLKQKNDE